MAVGNRIAELGSTDFETEADYAEWHRKALSLLKDLAREFEDAGEYLYSSLSVIPVLNSHKGDSRFTKLDPRSEHKTQAKRISRSLKRAATSVSTARTELTVARAIFLQFWTKDGGFASAKNSTSKSKRMTLTTSTRSRRKSA